MSKDKTSFIAETWYQHAGKVIKRTGPKSEDYAWCGQSRGNIDAKDIAKGLNLAQQVPDMKSTIKKLTAALKLVQFGNACTQNKCVACAGWDMGPNGETPGKHTPTCPVGLALHGKKK